MEEIQNRKLIIRIGRNTLSFTLPDPADKEQPLRYEPYVVKGGISMAANLREALKTATLPSADVKRVQVVLDTPSMLVPIEQFEEENINDLYTYTFAPSQEPRKILFNVLPDLKAVCLFPINKDLYGVINDRYLRHILWPSALSVRFPAESFQVLQHLRNRQSARCSLFYHLRLETVTDGRDPRRVASLWRIARRRTAFSEPETISAEGLRQQPRH